jgi:hypothetical protein
MVFIYRILGFFGVPMRVARYPTAILVNRDAVLRRMEAGESIDRIASEINGAETDSD